MFEVTPRIERLRAHALEQLSAPQPLEAGLLFDRAWLAAASEPWKLLRRARATAGIVCGLTPVTDPDELPVCRLRRCDLLPGEAAELRSFREHAAPTMEPVRGQTDPMAIDFDKLLRMGVAGLVEQIADYRARVDVSRPDDLEEDVFYRSCLLTLDALAAYARTYSDLTEAQAVGESDPQRRAELAEIAAV